MVSRFTNPTENIEDSAMITIENLNNITIDNDLEGADIVTAAQWAFANGRALDLLSALEAYDSSRQPEAPQITEDPRVAELQQKIALLEGQLSQYAISDWAGLIEALKPAGFYDWIAETVAIDSDYLDDSIRLSNAAGRGDRVAVIAEYQALYAANPPSSQRLQDWQAVLDDLNIPKNLLAFIP